LLLDRLKRPTIAFVHDIVMAALSFVLAFYLRVGDAFRAYPTDFLIFGTVTFTAIAAIVFLRIGLYRGIWRYASLSDLGLVARAVTLIILIFVPVMFFVTRLEALPRSLPLINWFVLLILLAGPRAAYRMLKDGRLSLARDSNGRRIDVLLVGAGDNAEMFIQATERVSGADYRVVGIVDDSPGRLGRAIRGVEVLGSLDNLEAVIEKLTSRDRRPQRLVIAKPEIAGERIRVLVEQAGQLGIAVARLPRLTEFREAAERIEVKPIAIEDLLGRPQTVLDRVAMKALVEGRRVLITGAGGTIGSELVRQVSDLGPARLVLLDASEFNLYSIDLEVGERHPSLPRRPVLADVRDRAGLDALLADERPQLVFHAAALKHVPMAEAHPVEAVLTNVIGTRNLAEACRTVGVAVMVLISTDKAVNPTSVMGATKRLAESYCQALDIVEGGKAGGTRYVTVRFGNVLGSTGSVVPLFQRQLAAGGPLTVTHPDIQRYFMTVREAVELVLQASVLGAGGDAASSGKIFVLDMGDPVRIQDLARQMIRLTGLRPDKDVKIVFTGLRPGEKLYEELFHAAEPLQATAASGILLADPRTTDHAFLARAMDELDETARARRIDAILAHLKRFVPEFGAQRPDDPAARVRAMD
jgi:O-antigen biosynthesis protein WbqV